MRIRAASATGRACVTLEMPPPAVPPEAYFVAVVDPARHAPDPASAEPSPIRPRYFTLEVGGRDARATFLCEWTPDGRHSNLGAGPRPDARAFLEAIDRRLHEEAAPSAGAIRVQQDEESRVVTLPGVLSLEGLTIGDLLDDLAGSGLDPEIVRTAYHADPERMIRRPWQVEALRAAGTRAVPALEASMSEADRRPWAALLLGLIDPDI